MANCFNNGGGFGNYQSNQNNLGNCLTCSCAYNVCANQCTKCVNNGGFGNNQVTNCYTCNCGYNSCAQQCTKCANGFGGWRDAGSNNGSNGGVGTNSNNAGVGNANA